MMRFIPDLRGLNKLIKHWWVTCLLGIAMLVAGIIVFAHPVESYLSFALFFGIMIAAAGLLQIFSALSASKGSGRGWILVGGILELILGVLLISNLGVTAVFMPFLIALWFLVRGIYMVVFAGEISKIGVGTVGAGTKGWLMFTAILLIISSLLMFIFPYIGAGMVIFLLGISFLIAGISTVVFSFKMRGLKKRLSDYM